MPLTETDRAEINKTLQEVLHTAQHPAITFQSTRVGGSAASFTLDGELTIMRVTRPVKVQGRRTDGRVVGRAAVVQSRWGIRPYSALFGALKLRGRGHGRLRRGPHAERLTALGRGACPGLQPCIRSSEPFVGAYDLGVSSAALAVDRRNRPVLLSAVHQKVVEEL